MRCLMLSLTLFFAATSAALADDVTLTNGKVYKDLTLLKETKSAYIFVTHEGRKLTLAKRSVAKVEKKPTVRGELQDRIAELPKRDPDAMVDLGLWAQSKGMNKDAKDLFKKALRIDRKHARAHEASGDKLLDGKWVRESTWRKAMAKKMAAQYKAWGWKEIKGEWFPPTIAQRQKDKLVQIQGQWVAPKRAKKIEKDGLTFAEGAWLTPEEKKKFDDGLRKYEKRWMSIEDLDDIHTDFEDPWVIKTTHFEVRANCKHRDAAWVAKMGEWFYKPLQDLFGEEHRDMHGKNGRMVLFIGRGVNSYKLLGSTIANGDRASFKSSGYGSFYSSNWGGGRGAGCTYIEGNSTWNEQWVANAVTHAFIGRMTDHSSTEEKTVEALAGYIAGHGSDGKYHPPAWMNKWAFNSDDRPMGEGSTIIDRIGYRTAHTILHGGFYLHFLRTKNDEAFRKFFRDFLTNGSMKIDELTRACLGQDVGSDEVNKQFAEFLDAYKASYTPGPRRS